MDSTYLVADATAIEPAPHVVDLNAELANLDDILTEMLPPPSKAFVLAVSGLMDATLVGLVSKVKVINREGVGKMLRNILALQQNLKNILLPTTNGGEVTFERSRKFYELLYSRSPTELLGNMKKFQQTYRNVKPTAKSVGFAELQAILNLALA